LRMLVLRSLYDLLDEQIEYQVRDRLSFTRFLGLGNTDVLPTFEAHGIEVKTTLSDNVLTGQSRGSDQAAAPVAPA
jgi:hypothetical protein